MSILPVLKNIAENLPLSIGRPLAIIPFSLRLGPGYWRSKNAIQRVLRLDTSKVQTEIIARLRFVINNAIEHVEFYREFYRKKGFILNDFQTLKDWERIPVVTRDDLQDVPFASRIAYGAKGMKANTGGTSGQPLEFLLDRRAFAREWAHMHYVWNSRGYRQHHLKLTFRGKHFDPSEPLRYNSVHNEFIVNANSSMSKVVDAVTNLPRSTVIRWVHGYPSLVAEFAHTLAGGAGINVADFRSRLFGVLLGSEYPAQMYRSVIEKELSTNVVSWYGHSEMAVLARETALGVYESLPTYGYAEAVPTENGVQSRLVCTSLHNQVHPFIRYDTGDLIEPVSKCGGSLAFRISEGRIGDFVLDRKGNRHSLTALIFGRHHAAFELIKHIQVREEVVGCITLVVTPRDRSLGINEFKEKFDLKDLDIDWRFEIVEEPVRTRAGKIRLKISQ